MRTLEAEHSRAAWAVVDDVTDSDAVLTAYLAAANRLSAELERSGSVPLGPLDFKVSTEHALDFSGKPDGAVMLVECRALVLRNPNPFPRFRLFGRSR